MMPAYNAASYIEVALQSLLRQRNAAEMEIIVINDGSTDSTSDILHRMSNQFDEIKLVETENGGVTRARNIALAHIAPDADLVSFLDSDDLSPMGRFERDIETFRNNPDLDLVYSTLRLFETMDRALLEPTENSDTLDVRGIHLGAGLYKTSFIQSLGGFDEDFVQAEDTDFLLRALESQPKFMVTSEIGYYYRKHGGGLTREKSTVVREFSRALLKSSKRRKVLGPDFQMPQDVFDIKAFTRNPRWA
ncbi:glycosyl transferase family 2 [Cohaesibacter celericrescens]|uniref:Glycosyl transferase family 2 n=2 Tax=Cohaesibacter celericrescens TaxID=2067669 RepID=A0A2N5XQB2_9HYPH|nr:glycosyl transferase family 2 [Cohaesibacter celericrescens]